MSLKIAPKIPTQQRDTSPKQLNLGKLDSPGGVLGKTTQKVSVGGSLSFRAITNQIYGVGTLTVTPKGAARITQTLVKARQPGDDGGTTLYEYKITLAKNLPAGKAVTVSAPATYQSRNDPKWAFQFKLEAQ